MSGNIREIIESHYCFCKVSPCYIGSEDRTEKGARSEEHTSELQSL
jgi:hypothetical protein